MKPRRLHSDTIFSIRTFSFGSTIGLVSVCDGRRHVNATPERSPGGAQRRLFLHSTPGQRRGLCLSEVCCWRGGLLGGHRGGQIFLRVGVVRLQFERFLKLGYRFIQITFLEKNHTEIIVSLGVVWTQLKILPILADGFIP
jgi:hypothetical protein